MAVFRIEKTKDYTVMSNYHLRDKTLSLKAKGLLSLMLSLPDEWDYSLKGLSCICQDGIGSVRTGVAELEAHGYLTRRRIREVNGQLGDIEYTIHEVAQPTVGTKGDDSVVDKPVENTVENRSPVCKKPTSKKPICENPTQANPIFEDCTQLNTNANQELNKSNIDGLTIHQSIPHEHEPSDGHESGVDAMDGMEVYREILKENIEYDHLCREHPYDKDELSEILEIMLETICTGKRTIRVGGEDIPAEVVKSRMLKLDQMHIEYVLECLSKNTTDVRNIKSYLLTTLYNAPFTIGSYYKSRVNHDFKDGYGV